MVYLEDSILTPDNNLAENATRPFVLGCKNWLFIGMPEGAEASTQFYSLIETTKANGCEPYSLRARYLKIQIDSLTGYEALLSWNLDRVRIMQIDGTGG